MPRDIDHEDNSQTDPFVEHVYSTYKHLLKSNTILLNGDIKDNIVERLVIPLTQLTKDHPRKRITILLNSFGGSGEDGQIAVDTIRRVKNEVTTVVLGKAMSSAFDIFLAGDIRILHENSVLMCHAGHESHRSKPLPFLNVEAKVYEEYFKRWAKFYASRTKMSFFDWMKIIDSGKDRVFFPEEALKIGIATKIYKPTKK